MNKTVLITGASSGIGEATAYIYAENNYNIILAARRKENLERIKADIEKKHPVAVDFIVIDLAETDSAENLYNKVKESGSKIDILINNAGFGISGDFKDTDIKREEKMLILNMLTLTKLTKLFLKEMLKNNSGHIINIASTGAFQPVPLMACYAATKAYVHSFSEAIAYELRKTGVKVTSICPGPTVSEFGKVADVENSNLFKKAPNARNLAEFIFKSMKKGKVTAIHKFKNKFLAGTAKFAPRKMVLGIAANLMKNK